MDDDNFMNCMTRFWMKYKNSWSGMPKKVIFIIIIIIIIIIIFIIYT